MKKAKKSTFFIVLALIILFVYTSFSGVYSYYGDNKTGLPIKYFNVFSFKIEEFRLRIKGIEDIRWGIDISGGVEAAFTPPVDELENITTNDMKKAEEIIKQRLVNQNITDAEVVRDDMGKQIVVRFPWKSDEANFDPAAAVEELGSMAVLTFNSGNESEKGEQLLEGSRDVESATYQSQNGEHQILLKLTKHGKTAFAKATKDHLNSTIAIWLDNECLSAPTVNDVITNGEAIISGDFTAEEAQETAALINAGSLPFDLSVDQSKLSIIAPTLGKSSLDVMLVAGIIAYAIIVIMMLVLYRLPGFVAVLSLTTQIAGIFACISGFLPFLESFTLTIPGLAGIILSIGMGVDANVINAERIKDEINTGRTIDGSIKTGFKRAFSAIIDGNVTVVIVSVILMGAFGPADSLFAKILSPLMFMFSSSITGSVYSFGYTLLIGAIFNILIGVLLSKVMTQSLASFKCLRKPWLYGGKKNV